MFGAQVMPPNMPTAASCCAGRVDSSTVKAERNGTLPVRPACDHCLTKLTPRPPGRKAKTTSGFAEAILASSAEKSSEVSGT